MTTEEQKISDAVADKLLGIYVYQCEECDFGTDDVSKLDGVRDITQRVLEGEIMMSGECPECGSGIGCPGSKIPDYTIRDMVIMLRKRGWKIEEPK